MYWPYAFVLAMVEYGDTCAMGGEGFLPSLFVGGPIVVLATVVLWLLRPSVPLSNNLRWALVVPLGLSALVTMSQIWNVTIMSHHPCGADYDAYLLFVETWDRWIPVLNLSLIAIAGLVGLGPFVRKMAT